jgi:hypothetical protein
MGNPRSVLFLNKRIGRTEFGGHACSKSRNKLGNAKIFADVRFRS